MRSSSSIPLGLALLGLLLAPPLRAGPTLPGSEPISPPTLTEQAEPADAALKASLATIRARQYNPLRAARLLSYVSVAQQLAVADDDAAGLSAALMAQAAARTLHWLSPQENPAPWERAAQQALAGLSRGEQGRVELKSEQVAQHLLMRSLTDGADARRRPLLKPAWQPGLWARTPPLFAEQPVEPQAPQWRPWCEGSQAITAPAPPPHGSPTWRADMREVKEVRQALSEPQKRVAEYWNLEAGSVTPPGLWNQIAMDYLRLHPRPAAERARILALLNRAMHDALVAAWRVKLHYWTERPLSAIQREFDPPGQPAFTPWLMTPPFPGYVSGHAAVSGAAAAVLSHSLPQAAARWQALAEEAAVSRLWGGIHPRHDNQAGLALGTQVGQACLALGQGSPNGPGGGD